MKNYPGSVSLFNESLYVVYSAFGIRILQENGRDILIYLSDGVQVCDLDRESHGGAARLNAGDRLRVQLIRNQEILPLVRPLIFKKYILIAN